MTGADAGEMGRDRGRRHGRLDRPRRFRRDSARCSTSPWWKPTTSASSARRRRIQRADALGAYPSTTCWASTRRNSCWGTRLAPSSSASSSEELKKGRRSLHPPLRPLGRGTWVADFHHTRLGRASRGRLPILATIARRIPRGPAGQVPEERHQQAQLCLSSRCRRVMPATKLR